MDWDDLKVLLALSRKGSARGAAQILNVSNSTVTRRLDELERRLHTQLFDRTPDGYRMTAAAEQLLPTAEHVEDLVLGAERKIIGGDQELTGTVRLTLPDIQGMGFLMQRLSRFAAEYPDIELVMVPTDQALDLSRREADIAIRVVRAGISPPEYLIGRPIAQVTASAYIHRDLLNAETPSDISHLNWIGKYPESERDNWVDDTDFPDLPVRHSVHTINLMAEAIKAKMGVGLIPCIAAYSDSQLVRVPGAQVVHHSDMWVLSHKDLRLTARMRIVREMIAEEFAKLAPRLDSRMADKEASPGIEGGGRAGH